MASTGTPWGWPSVRNTKSSRYTGAYLHQPKPEEDAFWRSKRLSPSRIQVYDITIEDATRSPYHPNPAAQESRLSCDDADIPDLRGFAVRLEDEIEKLEEDSPQMIAWEKRKVNDLLTEYGWMKGLRNDSPSSAWKCRWVHVPALFPDHLRGVLLAMSKTQSAAIKNCRVLDDSITQNERFSIHGKYFSPFFKQLPHGNGKNQPSPTLVSFPFLDWTIHPEAPVETSQAPPGNQRLASHPIRSMLQYFYRLENTTDRENAQVYHSHQPWANDPDLFSKVQRWYGHLPTGLAVDEMWILVLDSQHIVSFSSNQSWKPLWPAHQVPNRIAEISFRTLRNTLQVQNKSESYDAFTHAVACVDGAAGLLHWSSWLDIVLCLTDRFGNYLNHLQYRLHRSANTKLVMDLLQLQDELGIVLDITRKQCDLVGQLRNRDLEPERFASFGHVVSNLDRERSDLEDLQKNCDTLVTRTVQLVNIRLEDHGKAILVFTIVTIVFLPLSFVATVFGMNTNDIRNLERGQGIFWACALSLTAVVVAGAIVTAFYGGNLIESLFEKRGDYQNRRRSPKVPQPTSGDPGGRSSGFSAHADRDFNVKGFRLQDRSLGNRFQGS